MRLDLVDAAVPYFPPGGYTRRQLPHARTKTGIFSIGQSTLTSLPPS